MSLYRLSLPLTFCLGESADRADVEISITAARAIEIAAGLKIPGKIFLSDNSGLYQLANYDGLGNVFNGSTSFTPACPEQMLLLADVINARREAGLDDQLDSIGGLAFYRQGPWKRSPLVLAGKSENGRVTAFSMSEGMSQEFETSEVMSVGELVAQARELLICKSQSDWERRLLERIEALAFAAVAARPTFYNR